MYLMRSIKRSIHSYYNNLLSGYSNVNVIVAPMSWEQVLELPSVYIDIREQSRHAGDVSYKSSKYIYQVYIDILGRTAGDRDNLVGYIHADLLADRAHTFEVYDYYGMIGGGILGYLDVNPTTVGVYVRESMLDVPMHAYYGRVVCELVWLSDKIV